MDPTISSNHNHNHNSGTDPRVMLPGTLHATFGMLAYINQFYRFAMVFKCRNDTNVSRIVNRTKNVANLPVNTWSKVSWRQDSLISLNNFLDPLGGKNALTLDSHLTLSPRSRLWESLHSQWRCHWWWGNRMEPRCPGTKLEPTRRSQRGGWEGHHFFLGQQHFAYVGMLPALLRDYENPLVSLKALLGLEISWGRWPCGGVP